MSNPEGNRNEMCAHPVTLWEKLRKRTRRDICPSLGAETAAAVEEIDVAIMGAADVFINTMSKGCS